MWKILVGVGVGIILGGFLASFAVEGSASYGAHILVELQKYYPIVREYANKTGDPYLGELACQMYGLVEVAEIVSSIPRDAELCPAFFGAILVVVGLVLMGVKRLRRVKRALEK